LDRLPILFWDFFGFLNYFWENTAMRLSMRLPLYFVLFLLGLAIAQIVYFYPLLPEIVGSHFNADGKVNGTSTKSTYFSLYFVTLAIASFSTFGFSLILKYLPTSLINLPHRQYWLSDEHREETFNFFKVHFAWFGVAMTALIITVFHLTFLANLSPNKNLTIPTAPWYLLVAFFLFLVWWTVVLLRRFPKPL
jgi:uncharacterized membrane protein